MYAHLATKRREGGKGFFFSLILSLSLSFSRRNTPRWSVFSTPFEQSRVGHSEARSVLFMRKFALGATTLGAIPLFLKLFPPTVPRDDIRLPIPSANRHPSVDPCSRVVERIQLDCSANTRPYCYARILRGQFLSSSLSFRENYWKSRKYPRYRWNIFPRIGTQ